MRFCGPPTVLKSLPQGDDLPVVMLNFDKGEYDDQLFRDFSIWLPDKIRASYPSRRAEYLAGRICAQSALTLINRQSEHIATGLSGEPIWPEGVRGSVSHSGSCAVACATSEANFLSVGLDVQPPASWSAKRALLNIAAMRSDFERLNMSLISAYQSLLPELLFSARESFFKAFFPVTRQWISYHAVSLRSLDWEAGKIYVSVTQNLGAPFKKDTIWEIEFGRLENGSILTQATFPKN